jgi:hypothetical protein
MKSYLLSISLFLLSFSILKAQNYEPIKSLMILSQIEKAKSDIDKSFSNTKFTAKPEAHILKSNIYVKLSSKAFAEKVDTALGSQLTEEADNAFKAFSKLDTSMKLLSDPTYFEAVILLYNNFYYLSIYDYNKKDFLEAINKVNKAIYYSDILIKNNVIKSPLDTNILEIGASIAEVGGLKDEAARFYKKLADFKVTGERYEGVYKYLVSYSFAKKNMIDFETYRKLGKENYPNSEYFDYDKVDFAVGLANSFNEKLKAIEELLAIDPDNFKANQVLGEILYDTLKPREQDVVFPTNYNDLEKRMIEAFTKAAKANPENEIPYVYIGDHFINKALAVSEKRDQHAQDMKARTKPGTMASKEDIAKRDALDKEYAATLEGAIDPYEKAVAIFEKKSKLDTRDVQLFKKAVSWLSDIFAFKRAMAGKAKNTAEQNKWAAEEKKWNERYESIKN